MQQEQPRLSKKEEKKKEVDELNHIFKPVAVQKIDKSVNPKSVLCAFFKQGQCTKGDKCKFSHDLSIERKAEKRNLYCDNRDVQENDTMENWDENKLKEVVEKKHGENERKLPKTDIICKYFIDAVENNKYGWFWECPNGGDKCHYRHALPPGFVLNKDKKKEKKDEISIEDLVEKERATLGLDQTKITLESFLIWKKKKMEDKKEQNTKEQERKKAEFKAGRIIGLSGREMFTFNPDLVVEDQLEEGEAAFENVEREDQNDNVNYREINFENLEKEAQESDGTGTQAIGNRFASFLNKQSEEQPQLNVNSIPIDENLFADDEDLDQLDEELNLLNIN